jgi:protein-S-isoprenylcysteine O-methyltransferase Ste14
MRRGTFFVVAQSVLFVAVAVAPRMRQSDWPDGLRIFGVALALAGAVLCVWGVRALGPAMTALPEPRPHVPVATRGPYRAVRHPVYAGVLLICLGVSLGRSTWLGVVLTAILAVLFDVKARYEERLLRRDPDYAAYAERTRSRFVPRVY